MYVQIDITLCKTIDAHAVQTQQTYLRDGLEILKIINKSLSYFNDI